MKLRWSHGGCRAECIGQRRTRDNVLVPLTLETAIATLARMRKYGGPKDDIEVVNDDGTVAWTDRGVEP